MDANLPETTLACTQCGGELHPDEGQITLNCPYCNSSVYLDKSKVVFHWFIAPTLDEDKARASLARWMAGNQTVKDLDKKSQISSVNFTYFPMWYFKRRSAGNREEILLEPAAATSVSEIRQVKLPAGDLRKYHSDLDAQSHAPTVPLPTALAWLADREIPAEQISEQSLVHIPVYTFKYDFQGKSYTAVVEAATGGVFANIFPAKAEAPFLLVGGLTALVFLCLALIPLIGGATEGGSGAGVGFLVCIGAGIVAAPMLFALAAWIAAKV